MSSNMSLDFIILKTEKLVKKYLKNCQTLCIIKNLKQNITKC